MENKRIEYSNIIYCINKEEKAAYVIGFKGNYDEIHIPRSIKYESKEYDVTSILKNVFKRSHSELIQFSSDSKLQTIGKNAFSTSMIRSIRIPSSVTLIGENAFYFCQQLEIIEIPNDSKLQTIGKCAFHGTAIDSITIPSELVELKEGWCDGILNLTKIEVSSRNPRYCCYEDKMIIGKTNINQNNYDCLVFCVRDVKHVKIPNFIEHICSYSFDSCQQLEFVEIPNDSKLQTIDKCAFSFSSIKSIRIPSSVTLIGEYAFLDCQQLDVIEIQNDSKLQTIDKGAFSNTEIDSITIPSELIELKEGWCYDTMNLTKIKVSPNNPRYCYFDEKMIIGKTNIDQSNYDCLVFCVRDIKYVKIPNFIEHICSYSFNLCQELELIEIPSDSKLQTIDKYAFASSTIESIAIPSSVTLIGEGAFSYCEQLEEIKIPNDSKLQTIHKNVFSNTEIDSITIPSELIELKEGWCYGTLNLMKIDVSPNNPRFCCYDEKMIIGKTSIDQPNYDCIVFCFRDTKYVKIPYFIEHICSYSFDHCRQLELIEIPNDSNLQIIDKFAFSKSVIKSIKIPSSVTLIGENAFYYCEQLELIEIPNDSKLQTIDKLAFSFSTIKSIMIPSSVKSVGEDAFFCCKQLLIIEINFINEAEMISIYQTAFKNCKNSLLMIPVHFKVNSN